MGGRAKCEALRACSSAALGASCGEASICAPMPGAPFAETLCIHRPGDVACPAGDYGERFVRYASYADDRGCSACSCSDPQGGDCDASIAFWYDSSCESDYLTMTGLGSGGCTTLWGDAPDSGTLIINEITGSSCEPSGGEAQGAVAPDDAVTFCCTG